MPMIECQLAATIRVTGFGRAENSLLVFSRRRTIERRNGIMNSGVRHNDAQKLRKPVGPGARTILFTSAFSVLALFFFWKLAHSDPAGTDNFAGQAAHGTFEFMAAACSLYLLWKGKLDRTLPLDWIVSA